MPDKKKKLSAADFVRKVKAEREEKYGFDYRRAALSIHPHICTRCSREFDGKDLSLLTVHHKDGNHDNNPRDGSNWELLCVYCHDDEHSREVLADKISHSDSSKSEMGQKGEGMLSMAEKLKAALEKK